jgi:hypothetical protein
MVRIPELATKGWGAEAEDTAAPAARKRGIIARSRGEKKLAGRRGPSTEPQVEVKKRGRGDHEATKDTKFGSQRSETSLPVLRDLRGFVVTSLNSWVASAAGDSTAVSCREIRSFTRKAGAGTRQSPWLRVGLAGGEERGRGVIELDAL